MKPRRQERASRERPRVDGQKLRELGVVRRYSRSRHGKRNKRSERARAQRRGERQYESVELN
eukprot:scaffold132472_cov30-Tisochrysis_lutea.AAC.1